MEQDSEKNFLPAWTKGREQSTWGSRGRLFPGLSAGREEGEDFIPSPGQSAQGWGAPLHPTWGDQARSTGSRELAPPGGESIGKASLPDQPPAVVRSLDHLHHDTAVERELVRLLSLIGPPDKVQAACGEQGRSGLP